MPEFVLPAEADKCPHCGNVLTLPPVCCRGMIEEHNQWIEDHLTPLPYTTRDEYMAEYDFHYGDSD